MNPLLHFISSRQSECCFLQVTDELVKSMRHFFAPYNAELQELLGRPLPESWSLPDSPRWRHPR